MIKTMRESSLHISISGTKSELDNNAKEKIEHTFKSLFNELANKVSEADDSIERITEIIYEIKTPIIQDPSMTGEFFENLEVLFYELIDFNPHFTKFRRVEK